MLSFYGDPVKYLKGLTPEEKEEKLDKHKKRLAALRGMEKREK